MPVKKKAAKPAQRSVSAITTPLSPTTPLPFPRIPQERLPLDSMVRALQEPRETVLPSVDPLSFNRFSDKDRFARMLEAIQSKVGPAAAKRSWEETGKGALRGALDILPGLEDARYAALSAMQQRGMSPLQAGLTGALVGGPIAAEQAQLAKDRIQMAALAKLLGLQERETGMEIRAATGEREGVPTIVETPMGKRLVFYPQPGIGTQVARAKGVQEAVQPGKTQAEIESEIRAAATRAIEEARKRKYAERKISASDLGTAASNAAASLDKVMKTATSARIKAAAMGLVSLPSDIKGAINAVVDAEYKRDEARKVAGLEPLPSSLSKFPVGSAVYRYLQETGSKGK